MKYKLLNLCSHRFINLEYLRPIGQWGANADFEEYLSSAAQEGPAVVLNTTELRSDAILLTKEQMTRIPLPNRSPISILGHKH